LTWDDHISFLSNKVSKNIGILRRIKNKIPISFLRNLNFTLINLYFEYCNVIWAISSSIALVKLFRIQKRAIHLIANSEWNAHTAPLFRDLKILTIHQLNLLQVALFMFKIFNNLLPQYFIDMFVPNCTVHSHNTRQRDDFHVLIITLSRLLIAQVSMESMSGIVFVKISGIVILAFSVSNYFYYFFCTDMVIDYGYGLGLGYG